MSQKSSLPQPSQSVSKALIPDRNGQIRRSPTSSMKPNRVASSYSTKHSIKGPSGITRCFPFPYPYGTQGTERDDEHGDERLCSGGREKAGDVARSTRAAAT